MMKNRMMKKTASAALALLLGLTLCGAVSAESASDAEETAAAAEAEEESSFLSWISTGVDMISDAVSTGWDKAGEILGSGWDWLREKTDAWIASADAYLSEHQWDEEVQQAWDTLKEGAVRRGEIAADRLEEAYKTVRDWFAKSGEAIDESMAEAVDGMAAAAGVAEAKVSMWFRQMEAYMTEKKDLMTDAARDAWATVRQNAEKAGSVASEELDKACETLRGWLLDTGVPEDSEAVTVLDELKDPQ